LRAWSTSFPGWIPLSFPLTPVGLARIAGRDYDVVHTQHPFTLGTAARMLARWVDLPLVCTIHTQYEQYVHYWSPMSDPGKVIVRRIVREFCNKCDRVVTVADGMETLLRNYGVEVPITVIPNDLDLRRFLTADGQGVREELKIAPDERFLLSVGRIAPEKNLILLLEAIAPILYRGGAKMVFVGDGPGRDDLEKRVDELQLLEHVIFTGKVPHEQTPRYYAAADLFLMPSITEVNPLTIGESLASGTPVVAIDSFSAREIIEDGVTGQIVPHLASALALAVDALVREPETLKQMGQTAREAARHRSEKSAAGRTVQLYQELIASRAAK
jgi:glycosyltransferase involved in cell wall biosynthesis